MSEKTTTKLNGTVKFFNSTKGFGFLKDSESAKEYFVHETGCLQTINENDEVEFDLKEGPRGPAAINVKII